MEKMAYRSLSDEIPDSFGARWDSNGLPIDDREGGLADGDAALLLMLLLLVLLVVVGGEGDGLCGRVLNDDRGWS